MSRPLGPIGDTEASAIISDLAAFRDQPPPSDPASGGCVVAIVSIITIVFMPFIGRAFELSGDVMFVLGVMLGLAALAGGLVGIFGGGLASRRVSADVERAVGVLLAEYPEGDEARYRAAAVNILDGAYHPRGPTTVRTFEADDLRGQLAEALSYVERMESFLLEREEIYPVFTMSASDGDEAE